MTLSLRNERGICFEGCYGQCHPFIRASFQTVCLSRVSFCQLLCHMFTCSGFYFFLQAMVMATFEKEALPQTVAVAYHKNVSQAPPCQPTWRIAGKLEAFSRGCSSLKPPLREHLVQTVGISLTSGRAAKSYRSGRMTNAKLRGCCDIVQRKRGTQALPPAHHPQ